jgi:N-glycosylase/DNA lyase
MLRSPTVFEDVVKTVCTTNCAWSATVRMVDSLVTHLGDPAVGGESPLANAFPTPAAMAGAPESFYREVVRAGYRGAYLIGLARTVSDGELDLERFATATPEELSDLELESALLALPGVGPYAAAHIMMTLGRHSRLILDSWTRPKYSKLLGRRKPVADRLIEKRFQRYGDFAGLAFWLFVTRDWVDDGPA